jgi:hypothetical protein
VSTRHAGFHERVWVGVLLSPIRTITVAALASIGLLLAAWVAHGTVVALKGDSGIVALTALIHRDLAHAASIATAQGLPTGALTRIVNAPYALLFEWSGIHAMGQRFAERDALSVPDTIVRTFYVRHHGEIQLLMLVTQLAGVRFALILQATPLVVLGSLLGAADGLVRREGRRATRSQESASLYHRAKYLQVWILAMTLVFVLLWPLPLEIRYVGLPIAIAMGVLGRWQWSLYKKYL